MRFAPRFRLAALPAVILAGSTLVTSCSCDGDDDGSGGAGQGAGSAGGAGQGGDNTGGGSFATTTTSSGTAAGGGDVGGGGVGGVNEACIFVPPAGDFAPGLDCAWNGPAPASPYQGYDDVVSTPIVINLTDDNADQVVDLEDIPDIAFITYRLQEDGCCNQNGVLRVISGGCADDGTMVEHFSVGGNEINADIGQTVWLDNSGGLAAGDIDADGQVDIVATTVNGGTIAFERDGSVKWHQPDYPEGGVDHLAGTQPSIADLDGDGMPEIVQGRVVLSGFDGEMLWIGADGIGTNGFMGPVSSAGDLDGDGQLEVLAGSTAYDAEGNTLWAFDFLGNTATATGNCQASGFPCDGFTATGNFDADDEGEVVIVRSGVIYFVNHDGSPMEVGGEPVAIAIPVDDCARNEGGPPTVADFDGDGDAEVGVASSDFYVVADLECLAVPLPAQCSDAGIRWKVGNADCSSRVTGSSVFDFDGDGKTEVVYNDEDFFRVFDGTNGDVLIEIANQSHTRLEMPVIADVDNDGNAEIVFAENRNGNDATSQGIRVYADATDSWVPTRRIWNQHSYHVTNVGELGQIPAPEPANWLEPTDATPAGVMNNFRQNLPAFDVFAAPDLTVTLSFDTSTCPTALGIVAEVCNDGALQVGAGVPVAFFDNATEAALVCTNDPTVTTQPIQPGQCRAVTCLLADPPEAPATIDVRACVDNLGYTCASAVDDGGNNECLEDNNLADDVGVGCQGIE